MKKFCTVLIAIILIVAIAGAVFVFAFDKKIPTAWANGVIKATKDDKFPNADNLPKNMKWSYEEITYTKDGDEVVTTYADSGSRQVFDKSTDEKEEYLVKCINLDSKGDVAEQYTIRYYMEGELHYKEEKGIKTPLASFDEVLFFYGFAVSDFYDNDLSLKMDIQVMIDTNLDCVTQQGLGLTLHLVKDNESINLTYSLMAKRLVRLEKTVDTYTDSVLTHRSHQFVEF